VLLPHWCGGIRGLATYHRYIAHLTLFIQREDAEGGTDRPLPHRTRHIDAAVHLPQLKGGPRVIIPGEVGLVPHLGRDLTDGQVPKHLAYTPVLPTTEEGNVRHRPLVDGVMGIIHTRMVVYIDVMRRLSMASERCSTIDPPRRVHG